MSRLVTTLGDYEPEQIGMILPHEHIFTDTRQGNPPGFGQGDRGDVVRLIAPQLELIKNQGIELMVECTPIGVGRRVDLVLAVSEAADFPVIVPTGIYREPWIPPWAVEASLEELVEWMDRELSVGIDDTGVRAGFVKLSAGDNGITPIEEKILRAAARAAKPYNAIIGSHTIRGSVVSRQLDILEEESYDASRFIWIHTQNEPDLDLHAKIATRGAWLEYDCIGSQPDDDTYVSLLMEMIQQGFGDQIMISQDRGWYAPGLPDGSNIRPYTYLMDSFVPKMRELGLEETVLRIMASNPRRAFARL